MKSLELSYYIINNFSKSSAEGITPLKLQKLLYYTHVWGLVSENKILDANFVKWEKGPVNTEVYTKFKDYGANKIPVNNFQDVSILPEQKIFIDFILTNYSKYSAITLSAMTHQDKPWIETHKNEIISETAIKLFYSKLSFAKNFPLDPINKPFYPVETDLHYSFLLDIPSNLNKEPFSYNSYNSYLELEKKSNKEFDKIFKQQFDLQS